MCKRLPNAHATQRNGRYRRTNADANDANAVHPRWSPLSAQGAHTRRHPPGTSPAIRPRRQARPAAGAQREAVPPGQPALAADQQRRQTGRPPRDHGPDGVGRQLRGAGHVRARPPAHQVGNSGVPAAADLDDQWDQTCPWCAQHILVVQLMGMPHRRRVARVASARPHEGGVLPKGRNNGHVIRRGAAQGPRELDDIQPCARPHGGITLLRAHKPATLTEEMAELLCQGVVTIAGARALPPRAAMRMPT